MVDPYDPECTHCTGFSAVRNADRTLVPNKQLCQELDTCTASIDWDELHEKRHNSN